MDSNLPFGTYVQDGVRSGPLYTGQISSSLTTNPNIPYSYSSYGAYGPGILFSPQFTWTIVPNEPNPDGYTIENNVVAATPATSITSAGYLQIRGDGYVTLYVAETSSSSYVQLDWPRVITVTVSGEVAGNRNVTIFGTDWYGFPMQHTYAIDATGTYPTITVGEFGSLSVPAKAFYTVTAVYIDGPLGTGSSISLGAADVFGLPYFLTDLGSITSIGWGEVSDLTVYNTGDAIAPLGLAVPGTITVLANSGDVRGLYAPSTPADGINSLRFTYYVYGADVWINQVANSQFVTSANGGTNVGVSVGSLTAQDLYGYPQYYTGSPS